LSFLSNSPFCRQTDQRWAARKPRSLKSQKRGKTPSCRRSESAGQNRWRSLGLDRRWFSSPASWVVRSSAFLIPADLPCPPAPGKQNRIRRRPRTQREDPPSNRKHQDHDHPRPTPTRCLAQSGVLHLSRSLSRPPARHYSRAAAALWRTVSWRASAGFTLKPAFSRPLLPARQRRFEDYGGSNDGRRLDDEHNAGTRRSEPSAVRTVRS